MRHRAPAPIRMLALDVDGTIIDRRATISPRLEAAVGAACALGVEVFLATGRMYRSALLFSSTLGLTSPIVCYQGAYVREPQHADGSPGAVLYHRPMRSDAAREAIVWSRQEGFEPHLNVGDRLIMQQGDAGAEDYERLLGVGAELVPDLLDAARARPTKVLAVGPPGRAEAILERSRRHFDGRAQVTVSHPEYLEFNDLGVTKGRAVRWLARRRGVPLASVMAVGDQHNDLEMLQAAGYGVAMGTAPEAVRAAARFVTGTVEEDGAAVAIEALVLGRGTLR